MLFAVATGAVVEFDVTGAIAGDGIYDLALDTSSADGVTYASTNAKKGQKPVLVLTTAPGPTPFVTVLQPASGPLGRASDLVTLRATVADDRDVNLAAALVWTSDVQGPLGTGPVLALRLREGRHVLTARATDSQGLTGSAQVTVDVAPPVPPGSPLLGIIAPREGRPFATGEAIALVGVADDPEEGLLSARIEWTSNLDGPLGSGGSITRVLSPGAHRITARVVDRSGLEASAVVSVSVRERQTLVIPASAAVTVDGRKPNKKPKASSKLTVGGPPSCEGYLRFALTGVPDMSVEAAHLRLTVASGKSDGSDSGGAAYVVEDAGWSESKLTFATRPAVGRMLAQTGAVVRSDVVDFDVTAAVTGKGTYSFAVMSTSLDPATYRGRKASKGKPELHVVPGPPRLSRSGVFVSGYRNDELQPDTTVDLRGATFLASPAMTYPIDFGGGPGALILGGAVLGQYDRNWTWDQVHDVNNAGLVFENRQLTVDGLRVDNVADGIRPQEGGAFHIRNVWMSHIRDDCIENDHLQDGLVEDSLFDGCYVAFSARPSAEKIANGRNGSANVWRIQRSLVRLEAMVGPPEGSADGLGHGGFFKWHRWDEPDESFSPALALHGNVFMAERVGQVGAERMGIPPGRLASCSDNVMVWLGPGDYPAPLPACFTVTKDRAVWDAAVADWKRRHP
jgi:hypothetical protein